MSSTHFKRGDLAAIVNSRVPLLNDGHIVRIIGVEGPVPECKMVFGYRIERLDGQPFAFVFDYSLNIPVPGGKITLAHHWQLRRLAESGPKVDSDARSKERETIN